MIRFRLLGLAATALVLTACGAAAAPGPVHTGLTAADVVRELSEHGMDAHLGVTYQEEGVTGASFQADAIAVTGKGGGPADLATGGLIQVFADETSAAGQPRETSEHTYQVGNVLLRMAEAVPEQDARRYRTALEEILRQG
ncbi:hypothetical protein FDA94_11965 [Herbidospora galbida]|uniref:Uncharacterized protein n=1 Tax=Herbidospora galbida TaxID=2575442 RepID=A0A4U3MHG9_9ACTN|nr:hypothetical protein [Herbidospora galbida]TKK88795.1 hypothetical protein FDA94_11965 [Herbidospora galbida]